MAVVTLPEPYRPAGAAQWPDGLARSFRAVARPLRQPGCGRTLGLALLGVALAFLVVALFEAGAAAPAPSAPAPTLPPSMGRHRPAVAVLRPRLTRIRQGAEPLRGAPPCAWRRPPGHPHLRSVRRRRHALSPPLALSDRVRDSAVGDLLRRIGAPRGRSGARRDPQRSAGASGHEIRRFRSRRCRSRARAGASGLSRLPLPCRKARFPRRRLRLRRCRQAARQGRFSPAPSIGSISSRPAPTGTSANSSQQPGSSVTAAAAAGSHRRAARRARRARPCGS